MVVRESCMDYERLVFRPLPKPQSVRGAGVYADCVAAFDIETTRFTEIEQSAMYVWQLCLDFTAGEDVVIVGRTWPEFKHCLYHLGKRLGVLRLKIFVQNLSYEFSFLSGIYDFRPHEVFALESRSVLSCSMYKRFDFFCSYKLFNMSLAVATGKYAPEYAKKSGAEFHYEKRRYYDTVLTRKELLYAVYDVWGLCKAVRGLMALHNDNLYTLPRTSTGFVRREARKSMNEYRGQLCALWPDFDLYRRLRVAFRGGNTHANRFYAGAIIHNVNSVDISSSYPSQQCTKQFPVTPFQNVPAADGYMLDKLRSRGRALLLHLGLSKVKLRNRFESVPYLPIAKCLKLIDVTNDNGRILSAKYIEIVVTDIDYAIIEKQYSYNLTVIDMYKSCYGSLPEPLVELNRRYFIEKTKLKGVAGQELYYMKAKNLLNAIYGMSVQDPVRARIEYQCGEFVENVEKTAEELLINTGKNPYTVYQFGVWTTAHARAVLQQGIDICGDGLIYVDTDSCKYVGAADFSGYNREAEAAAVAAGAWARDRNGQPHYMGVYEAEAPMQRFITQGAKKYAYEDARGLHITVAGVPKKSGAEELARAGGLEAFRPGMVFSESGKLESVYNDIGYGKYKTDGRVINITKNVVLRETTYRLDITDDYSDILSISAKTLNEIHKFYRNCQL